MYDIVHVSVFGPSQNKNNKNPKKRNPERNAASARVRAQTSSLQLCIISLPSERRGQPGLEEEEKKKRHSLVLTKKTARKVWLLLRIS